MEEALVVGVTSDKKIAKVTLLNVPDKPGMAAQIFEDVAAKDINIRLIIQSAAADHRAGITFIIEEDLADEASKLVAEWKKKGLAKDGHGGERASRRSPSSARAWRPRRGWRAGCSRRWRAGHQRGLHQLVGDDGVLRHCGRIRLRRPSAPSIRSSSRTNPRKCLRRVAHHRGHRGRQREKCSCISLCPLWFRTAYDFFVVPAASSSTLTRSSARPP